MCQKYLTYNESVAEKLTIRVKSVTSINAKLKSIRDNEMFCTDDEHHES